MKLQQSPTRASYGADEEVAAVLEAKRAIELIEGHLFAEITVEKSRVPLASRPTNTDLLKSSVVANGETT